MFSVFDKVEESNRIGGILRAPFLEEIEEFHRFMELPKLSVDELKKFVSVYQPGATLRNKYGLNVDVGNYYPPRGGPHIEERLVLLLAEVNALAGTIAEAWRYHIQYESLHPFTDGNGRSGRMLWYWMMRKSSASDLGFLHAFYYQTLRHCGPQ